MPTTHNPKPTTPRQPLPPLVPLSRVAPEPVAWLSPGRIAAGKITLLDGDPGLGKSTLVGEFAARLSQGEPLPGGQPGPPRNVIIMSAEDDPHDTIRPRIDAAGGDPDRVVACGVFAELGPGGALLHLPDHVDVLREVIEKFAAALVVIDPLVAFLSPRLNANSDQAVRRALASLKTVAEQSGAAIIAVRHLNKTTSTTANPLYRGGGSIGLIGAARTALLLAPDPADSDRRILAATKSNLGPLPPALAFRLATAPGSHAAHIAWEGETSWTAVDLLRPAKDHQHLWSAHEEARAWLHATLADGPRPATEVQREAGAAGIARDTLYTARRAAGIRLHKDRTQRGRWFWALPASPEVPEVQEVQEVPPLD